MNIRQAFHSVAVVSLMATGGVLSAPVQAADTGASLQGHVTFKGMAPAPIKIKTTADPVCQQMHPAGIKSEEYVVSPTGGLANVFVYVKKGLEGKTFPATTTAATLTQKGCQYHPHVIGVQVHQPLDIVNEDSTLHNLNAPATINMRFNVAQPIQGMKTTRTFDQAEVMIPLMCNVHPWMKAYIGVVDHPFFAVSDETGAFEIKGLPAGTYVLEAWHEALGTAEQTITVKDGDVKPVKFVFTKK